MLSSNPLLSICVPTYNRAPYSEALVATLCTHFLSNPNYSIEVVVSNNKSTDDTAERLAKWARPGLTIINRTTHLISAEENMVSAVGHLSGEYFWFIGDDDIPNINEFCRVYRLLESGAYDCMIFNSSVLDPLGRLRSLAPLQMNSEKVVGPIDKIIESIGLLYTFAGITNVIQRRSLATAERGKHWIEVSKIYSHVAWIAEANIGKEVAFINSPLVYFRENDYSDGRWESAAKERGIQDLYNWTVGIVLLLEEMVRVGILTYRQVGMTTELSRDGVRYRLIDDIAFKTYQQIEIWVNTGDVRQCWSRDQLDLLVAFLGKADPLTYYITRELRDVYNDETGFGSKRSRSDVFDRFQAKYLRASSDRQSLGHFVSRFRCRVYGFEVYELPFQFVAIWADTRGRHVWVFDEVDPVGDGENVLVAVTMDEIVRAAVMAQRTKLARSVELQSGVNSMISRGDEVTSYGGSEGERLRDAVLQAQSQLTAVLSSTSWRVSAPVRWVGRLMKGRRLS